MSKVYNKAGFEMKCVEDFNDECMRANAIARHLQRKCDDASRECFDAGYKDEWLERVYTLRLEDLHEALEEAMAVEDALRQFVLRGIRI